MWTATLNLDPKRVLLTQVLGRIYPGAYVASFSPLQVQNLPRQPLPASNWVRVRNRLAGICGSDLHLICADGDFRIAPAAITSRRPTYLGHEVVGEVIEIGDTVQHLHVGDRVVLQYSPNCVSAGVQPLCRSCAAGNYNLCENGLLPGPPQIGAGWSEEMLLHEQQLFAISPEINDEQAVMLEPTAVALHTVLRCPPRPQDRVLIIGAGTIGLLTLQIVRLLAPQAEISILARHSFQVEQATRLGAAHIIYPQDPYSGVQRATNARVYNGMLGNRMLLGGYDIIYDTVGSKRTLHHALRWLRAQGTLVQAGISLHLMNLDLSPIWYQQINLLGSTSHGTETWPLGSTTQRSTFSIVAELLELGHLHPEHMVTHRFALNDYKHAISTALSKSPNRALKIVFDHALLPVSVVPNVRASAYQPRPAIIDANGLRKTRDDEAVEIPVTPPSPMPQTPVSPEPPASPQVPASPPPSPLPARSAEVNWEDQDTEAALPAVKPTQSAPPTKLPEAPASDQAAMQARPAPARLDISQQPTGMIPVAQPSAEAAPSSIDTPALDQQATAAQAEPQAATASPAEPEQFAPVPQPRRQFTSPFPRVSPTPLPEPEAAPTEIPQGTPLNLFGEPISEPPEEVQTPPSPAGETPTDEITLKRAPIEPLEPLQSIENHPIEEPVVAPKRPRAPRKRKKTTESLEQSGNTGEPT